MTSVLATETLRQELSELQTRPFSIEDFLAQERAKDLLRFSTAGSVDDGKSTLIGRLLYDTRSVYEDQVRSIEGKGSAGVGQLDFALLTDGLRAEREQGITIDVAYRYFSTARRKFIIADTPGHEQYTRNMATGASTADAAIVLVDARKGVLLQSRRHAYIASLLGVRHLIVAVNKMDLVDYSEAVFRQIQTDFAQFLTDAAANGHRPALYFLPVSALLGVNVVERSPETPWYHGPSLLELLETIPAATRDHAAAFRFPVQRVVRPHQHFRGFAGQIASGSIRVGDPIAVLPSGRTSRVERIVTFDGDLTHASAPQSITLTLADELDISRGDLLTHADSEAPRTRRFAASLVWMDARPFDPARRYRLRHTSHIVAVQAVRVRHKVDVGTLDAHSAGDLAMNDIGVVEVETRRPIALDLYTENRATGAFVLIDAETNSTAAAGMVREILADRPATVTDQGSVTVTEREARWGHSGAILALAAPAAIAEGFERALFERGAVAVRTLLLQHELNAALAAAGILALAVTNTDSATTLAINGSPVTSIAALNTSAAVSALLAHLRQRNILHEED
jgi:sulfate adenylyltransferase subunit 1